MEHRDARASNKPTKGIWVDVPASEVVEELLIDLLGGAALTQVWNRLLDRKGLQSRASYLVSLDKVHPLIPQWAGPVSVKLQIDRQVDRWRKQS